MKTRARMTICTWIAVFALATPAGLLQVRAQDDVLDVPEVEEPDDGDDGEALPEDGLEPTVPPPFIADLVETSELTDEQVSQLRADGSGWGNIKIMSRLAEQAAADSEGALTYDAALADITLLRSQGLGFGQIAQQYNTTVGKALGADRIGVEDMEEPEMTADPETPETMDMPADTDAGMSAKPEAAGRFGTDRPEKASKADTMDKPQRPEKPEKPEKAWKVDRPERPGKVHRPDRPGKPEKPNKPEKPEKPERGPRK